MLVCNLPADLLQISLERQRAQCATGHPNYSLRMLPNPLHPMYGHLQLLSSYDYIWYPLTIISPNLQELVTRQRAFEDMNDAYVARQLIEKKSPVFPELLVGDKDKSRFHADRRLLELICRHCWAAEPSSRPTAAEIADVLTNGIYGKVQSAIIELSEAHDRLALTDWLNGCYAQLGILEFRFDGTWLVVQTVWGNSGWNWTQIDSTIKQIAQQLEVLDSECSYLQRLDLTDSFDITERRDCIRCLADKTRVRLEFFS